MSGADAGSPAVYEAVTPSSPYWADTLRIYEASFPEWEREPSDVLAQRLEQGLYHCLARIGDDSQVLALSIHEDHLDGEARLLGYLAADPDRKGKGAGSDMCREFLRRAFDTPSVRGVFTEAETDRLLRFYGRLGFRRCQIDYRIPSFEDEAEYHAMNLIVAGNGLGESLDGEYLCRFLRSVYTVGYRLAADHPLVANCHLTVPNVVPLVEVV